MTSFLEGLPTFRSGLDSQIFFDQLTVMLQNVVDEAFAQATLTSMVEQASEPSQVQWEGQWVIDGNTLPIPPTAILMWKNTTSNVIGGMYGTTPLSSTVVRRESQNPRSGSNYWNVFSSSAAVTASTLSIGGSGNSNHPFAQIVLPVLSDLYLFYGMWTVLASGTGQWGADFLLDGEKVGTKYYSIPTNQGIQNISSTGRLEVYARIPNVPAGSHTIQAIFGVTGSPASPPALTYGGIGAGANNYGLRQMIIRAVTK